MLLLNRTKEPKKDTNQLLFAILFLTGAQICLGRNHHTVVGGWANQKEATAPLNNSVTFDTNGHSIPTFDFINEKSDIITECERNGFYPYHSVDDFPDPEYSRIKGEKFYVQEQREQGDVKDDKSSDRIKAIIDEFASQKCKKASSTPKLTYTSKGVCTFKLHTITNDDIDVAAVGYLSTLCSNDNIVKSLKDNMIDDPPEEKVSNWPDACVGDYQRCYNVKQNHDILLRHICTSKSTYLKNLPKETTHVSVDCRNDKVKKINWLKEEQQRPIGKILYMNPDRAQKERTHEFYKFIVFLVIVGIILCICLLITIHQYAFVPYLKAIKRNKSDPDLFTTGKGKSSSNTTEIVPLRSNV
jgi:hypothetical protein